MTLPQSFDIIAQNNAVLWARGVAVIPTQSGRGEGRRKMYWIYILKSSKDNNYYVCQTNNIRLRLDRHNSGQVKSTKRRLQFELIFKKEFNTRSEVIKIEKRLKRYKNQAYLEYLINNGLVV